MLVDRLGLLLRQVAADHPADGLALAALGDVLHQFWRRRGGGGRHAHLVEFDTKAHASKYYGNPSKHPGTKGQPFFQPAVDATEDQAMELMERSIGEQLEAYWNRQGGGQ